MKKRITIDIEMTENNIIEGISCTGDDIPKQINGKALMLSLFDSDTMDTVKIDLWTTDFQVQEMDRFVFQSLRSIADTYYKATKNAELASQMQSFIEHFGKKTEILIEE